jgi:hypothetical protein
MQCHVAPLRLSNYFVVSCDSLPMNSSCLAHLLLDVLSNVLLTELDVDFDDGGWDGRM